MREGQARVLNEKEFQRLIRSLQNRAHMKRNIALLYCSYGLGLRAKEMASLKIESVLDDGGELREDVILDSTMTKGRKQRCVFLTNLKVNTVLRAYLEERREIEGILFNIESPLFKSQKGNSFSANTRQQLFHRMYSGARMTGASSHSGRRTFATKLIENGIDIKAISTLMGHSSVTMTAKYIENNPIRLKKICSSIF